MKIGNRVAAVGVAFGLAAVLAGCGSGGTTPTTASPGGNKTGGAAAANAVVVHATASDFKWTLDKTTFKVGQPIQFDATSTQGMHGFSIVGTKINKTVPQGSQQQITWTPPKAGKYIVRCSVFCGSGHDTMFTSIEVQ